MPVSVRPTHSSIKHLKSAMKGIFLMQLCLSILLLLSSYGIKPDAFFACLRDISVMIMLQSKPGYNEDVTGVFNTSFSTISYFYMNCYKMLQILYKPTRRDIKSFSIYSNG